MLCSNCRTETATTGEGHCDGCSVAAANTYQPPVRPAVPTVSSAGLRSPVGLSYAVVALLGFLVAVDLFSIVVTTQMRGLMSKMITGDFSGYSDEEFDRVDDLMVLSGRMYQLGMLAAAVVFIVWFHRARKNAEIFALDVPRRGAGWAIGGWFIPIGNLWIPRGVAADIWVASRRDPYGTGKQEPQTLINLWWATWILSLIVIRFATGQYESAVTPEEIRAAGDVLLVADAVDAVAALLAILFVRRLTWMQYIKALHGPEPVAV